MLQGTTLAKFNLRKNVPFSAPDWPGHCSRKIHGCCRIRLPNDGWYKLIGYWIFFILQMCNGSDRACHKKAASGHFTRTLFEEPSTNSRPRTTPVRLLKKIGFPNAFEETLALTSTVLYFILGSSAVSQCHKHQINLQPYALLKMMKHKAGSDLKRFYISSKNTTNKTYFTNRVNHRFIQDSIFYQRLDTLWAVAPPESHCSAWQANWSGSHSDPAHRKKCIWPWTAQQGIQPGKKTTGKWRVVSWDKPMVLALRQLPGFESEENLHLPSKIRSGTTFDVHLHSSSRTTGGSPFPQ